MSELLEPTLLTGEGEEAPPPACVGPGCLRGCTVPIKWWGVAKCHLPLA